MLMESDENFKNHFPNIGKYDLFQRIYSQIAIYYDFMNNEFVIIKGCLNGKERTENELKILSLCKKCPYIIHLLGDISMKEDGNLYLIFPYFRQGDLKSYCENYQPLDGTQIKSVAIHLYEAAKFLEHKSIIHRDIKLENILVTSSAYYFEVKLIDFEWAIFHNKSTPSNEMCGTFGYMAPEVVDRQYYGFAVDIWSIAVVLYCLFTQTFPFGSRDKRKEYIKNTRELRYNDKHESLKSNPKFRMFLKKIFIFQHAGRLTASQCLESSWLQLNSFEALCKLI